MADLSPGAAQVIRMCQGSMHMEFTVRCIIDFAQPLIIRRRESNNSFEGVDSRKMSLRYGYQAQQPDLMIARRRQPPILPRWR